MKRLKIGVIGVGHMGQYHVNVVNMLKDKFILVGVFDASEARGKEIAARFETENYRDAEELVKKIDCCIIAVPTNLHYKYASLALDNNIHVLVEKPVTETAAQARELAEKAKTKKLIFQVGHVERFNGAVQELSKTVNTPLIIESRRLSPFSPRIKDVGVVLDLMIHDVDIVMNLVNSAVVQVKASGGSIYTQVEDYAHAVLQFESGCIASITSSRVTQRKVRTLAISQEKSYLFLDFSTQDLLIHRQASNAYLLTKENLKYSQESFVEEVTVRRDNPLKLEIEHFYDCVKNGATPMVSNTSDITVLETTLEIERQVREKLGRAQSASVATPQ